MYCNHVVAPDDLKIKQLKLKLYNLIQYLLILVSGYMDLSMFKSYPGVFIFG